MPQYEAIPVKVKAYEILEVLPNGIASDEKAELGTEVHCVLENGPASKVAVADPGMTARYVPVAGDYWVIQEDGYEYLNPKAVFERKYRKIG